MTKHTLPGSSENTFEDQNESDPIIEDLEVGIDALREELHLFANRRGHRGRQARRSNDAGDRIDLVAHGARRLGHPEHLRDRRIKFVEEQGRVHPLRREGRRLHAPQRGPLLEEAQLHPDDERRAGDARRAAPPAAHGARSSSCPIYVLVDNDPWGLYIYSVLKQGSINLAYESMRMAVPNVRFLGMSAFDYKKFKLTRAPCEIKLTKEDITRAEQMKAYPWFKDKKWQREIQALARQRLQDGGRRLPHEEHLLHHRGVHPEEAAG